MEVYVLLLFLAFAGLVVQGQDAGDYTCMQHDNNYLFLQVPMRVFLT